MNELSGRVDFNITVRVADMPDWSPMRITAFFQGLAKIIRAVGPKNSETHFFEEVNAAYAKLRFDPVAWAEMQAERRLWENTLMDGIETDNLPQASPKVL